MFADCCYCKSASWKIGLESNELPSLNKEFTYLLTYLLTYLYLLKSIIDSKQLQIWHYFCTFARIYFRAVFKLNIFRNNALSGIQSIYINHTASVSQDCLDIHQEPYPLV